MAPPPSSERENMSDNEIIDKAVAEIVKNRRDRRECAVPGARVIEWYDDKNRQPKTYEINGQRLSRYHYRKLVQKLEDDPEA